MKAEKIRMKMPDFLNSLIEYLATEIILGENEEIPSYEVKIYPLFECLLLVYLIFCCESTCLENFLI